jgi:lipopolysaccharide biosynthesis glycosyltransferase
VPAHIHRAVYLDSDVLVQADLSPLFTLGLDGAAVAGVRDLMITTTDHPSSGVRERDRSRPYFNAGVLVIDLGTWRDSGVGERLLTHLC